MRKLLSFVAIKICVTMIILLISEKEPAVAASNDAFKVPSISLDLKETDDPNEFVPAIKILLSLTILSIAPSILLMMTSFTRIVVVLSFLRQAMGTVNMPPNQVLIGLSLFLTYFTMSPVINDVLDNSYKPFVEKKLTQDQALEAAIIPVKKFMLSQTRDSDMSLFYSLRNEKKEEKGIVDSSEKNPQKLDLSTIIPAFLISELKTAFQIGFLIYIPFLVIDMVISSVLMAMGMVMLPPVVISLPFKIVLFVLIDGWSLITENIVRSFNR